MLDRSYFEELDDNDPLASTVARFSLPNGLVYLDGNSLGPVPSHVPEVVGTVVKEEWGKDLITSWNRNGWWTLTRRVGAQIAPLIGAPADSVVAGDTTTVAVYKAVGAARCLRPDRQVILTDSGNFPTDLYALGSVADQSDAVVEMAQPESVIDRIANDVAVVALTHVDYRTGRRHDLEAVSNAAREAGAVMVWDLAHSAGAMDLDLSQADMAVGCGYKYLNGGPGAPAFMYVNPRLHGEFVNPIAGWWGHADPFAMKRQFEPAEGIARVQVGTQPILSLASLHAALEVFEGVSPFNLRAKSERLVADFIQLVKERLEGFEIVTPSDPDARGSQVTLSHPDALAIMGTLIDDGVIGDVRPPSLLRFGLAPAFQRHVDVWDGIEALRSIMEEERWRRARSPAGPVT